MKAKSKKVTKYWLKFYISNSGFCSLCGNHGLIDTTNVRTPAGVKCGRMNYCICPNGQAMRKIKAVPLTGVPCAST